jgi:hypothetical protein
MAALSLRDQRLLARALDAAAEELDLPLTSRQVQALASLTAAKLADQVAARPAIPTGFQPPTA